MTLEFMLDTNDMDIVNATECGFDIKKRKDRTIYTIKTKFEKPDDFHAFFEKVNFGGSALWELGHLFERLRAADRYMRKIKDNIRYRDAYELRNTAMSLMIYNEGYEEYKDVAVVF